MRNFLKILSIDEYSITPKYLQLVNDFVAGIENGLVQPGDLLPSINDLSFGLDTSRSTIERFYNELKKSGIIGTIPGKGAYVLDQKLAHQLKILLLFNKLSTHKKIIYDAFAETLKGKAAIDFYVYNNDFHLFKKILTEKMDKGYNKIVVVPYFFDNEDKAAQLLDSIPKDKLIIMDKLMENVTGDYAAIYEDFEADIYKALVNLLNALKKYQTIKIIFPESTYYSKGIIQGFRNFCLDYFFEYEILPDISKEIIQPKTVYINIVEDDLVLLIQRIKKTGYDIGTDVGIISYNETAIKQVILNGITTISTSFETLGAKTAEVVLNNDHEHYAVPFTVNLRASL
ncbi:GntR family transcriptional regulator [Mucilaginibacter limnophilus]|uniref:GntR family transcriptional regulator n=1 Tax=Mucilaginibacter limnophilus TaxID=1932778 RepID=A0A437MTV2_9SPHI|nr:GntR family transcriptional regulator [Mucilaginibacter limnophilus]RVU01020.1 GntR family transcriptional regulator [Mucilaginibacter limnophilus]